jgi:hypothetical protein
VASTLPQSSVDYLASHDSDWIKSASDFSAGMADTITGGATAKIREGLGYNDVVDTQSDAYRYGGYAGQAVNIGLMAVNPAGWAGVAVRGINTMSTASNLIDAGQQALQGNFTGLGMSVLNAGLSNLRGVGGPCSRTSQLASYAQRGLHAFGVVQGAEGATDKFAQGDIIGGLLDVAQTGLNAYRFMQSCFAAEMLLDVEGGKKRADAIVEGDLVSAHGSRLTSEQ